MFARPHKKHGTFDFFFFGLWVTCCIVGPEHLSTYLKVYKVGDIIDIKVRIYAVHRLT